MKLVDFKAVTETLEYNEVVTIQYRSNWSGRANQFQARGQFAWVSDDGERIKLWNRDRPLSYRSIISIEKG